ncbi:MULTISPECIES: hypothetical protein [Mycolicibacterium]|uniref:Uncharacterized protein n=1 Tax=Mycolicibacterium austroafricanum TaxID=39687 RepID=A0ABT8H9H1_MYCAO|nr:hypothetical protein [Mycolicibacterium austroafricanum]MDN4517402.1 hypothetical protein [Mycolicibacterium austroafricanum]PQP41057.1 hypothetical protein C6A88_29555 [Mycolicibacterium austroafricanum]QRZ07628.1 hypothetical protein JN090_03455 [Mycolicibacterium austroafricanum]QZT69291.1 hypothetical protein JN086_04460 [Mycolicibacterium austroafricanum]QZY47007.1 hypothetical protein K5L12_04400 [Mycolicibacterium austroafricanum]
MTAARVLLVVAGVAAGLYGGVLLWDTSSTVLVRIAVWALVGVVVHDFVFAPLCAAAGVAWRTVIPAVGSWRSAVAVAALCSVVLVILAIPVYGRPGARPDNPTVLDRDYPAGLWISIALVWACVPAYHLLVRLLPVGQDQVVDRERADDVELQPPSR